MTKKLIVKSEMIPYLNMFDLNREWLNFKQERMGLIEEAHELRARMWALSHKITEIEEKISQAIVKLEKNNV